MLDKTCEAGIAPSFPDESEEGVSRRRHYTILTLLEPDFKFYIDFSM